MADQENYNLTISKTNSVDGTTENHTYSATNSEDLKKVLQLAGILPAVDAAATVKDCGCVDDCACGSMSSSYTNQDTVYDMNDTFEPHYNMDNWSSESYGEFVNNPSTEWPRIFENLSNDLQSKGLTEEEAEGKILELLDLAEDFDYGDGNPMDHQYPVSIKGMSLDKSSVRKFKHEYVQSRYADNPLSTQGELTETMEDRYKSFLNEQELLENPNKKLYSWNIPIGSTFVAGTPIPGGIQLWIIIDADDKTTEYKDKKDRLYSVRVSKLDKNGNLKTEEIVKLMGGQINRFVPGSSTKAGMYLGKLPDPFAENIDINLLNVEGLKKLFNPGVVQTENLSERALERDDTNIINVLMTSVYDYNGEQILGKKLEDLFELLKANHFTISDINELIVYLKKMDYEIINIKGNPVVTKMFKPRRREMGNYTFEEKKEKPKKVVLGKFVKSPELEITAIPVRDKVTGKSDYKVAIVDKFDNNNKQVVLLRGAGTDFKKMIERIKSTNELKFKRAGGVAWMMGEENIDEAGQRLDPKCWDGYKIGKPKTKISPATGKRVNNCVPESEIAEHQNYLQYVRPLRKQGFQIYVSKSFGGNGWLFEVEKDGEELDVYEPMEGRYFIKGDPAKQEYPSLVAAIQTKWPETGEVMEAGQRLDPKCWDGYKIGNPKTKISPQTGKRVNNCVKK